ncbi:hypothetical protein [Portibacter marinus]|uniref:hypothetical protein n=1 Tax=Portibacter marinus TaxID=2898660 RepID=UPI001F207B36|nr:hypothetical protein [Portibacter marinus]
MNRQDTIDPISQIFERISLPLKRKELSLILIVGVIGCIGTMSVFKKSFARTVKAPKNLSTIKIVEEATSVTPFLQNIDPFLNIAGTMHIFEPLEFSIGNYNPQAVYEVNFGDGQFLKGKFKSFKHAYQQEGKFDVELIIHYKNNSNSIFNTTVNIFPTEAAFLSSL